MSPNDKPPANDPEAEFLAEQGQLARRAIGNVFGDIRRELLRSADPRAWAKRYPLPTVAAAAVAGVGAGVAVRSALHHGDEPSNGNGATPSLVDSKTPESHDANPTDQPAKQPGVVASTLRSLATGLAGAAAEALVAATRQKLQTALTTPRDDATNPEPSA